MACLILKAEVRVENGHKTNLQLQEIFLYYKWSSEREKKKKSFKK